MYTILNKNHLFDYQQLNFLIRTIIKFLRIHVIVHVILPRSTENVVHIIFLLHTKTRIVLSKTT